MLSVGRCRGGINRRNGLPGVPLRVTMNGNNRKAGEGSRIASGRRDHALPRSPICFHNTYPPRDARIAIKETT